MLEYVFKTSEAAPSAAPEGKSMKETAAGLPGIEEPARRTPVRHACDVIVLGGGSAGAAAALAAARQGARVLLVERHGCFGGIMTACSLGTICGLYGIGADDRPLPLLAGIPTEAVERLRANGGAAPPRRWLGAVTVPYDLFLLKVTFDQMLAEAGVRLALHAQFVGVQADGGRVEAVIVEDKSGRWAARAPMVIDATGDADAVRAAGGECEFDLERLQLPTTTFRLGGVDEGAARAVGREQLRELLEDANRRGAGLPRTCGGVYFHTPGTPHLNLTRVTRGGRAPNPLDTFELAEAELEGRRQVLAYRQAFRDGVPGYRDAFVIDSGAHIGVRESRRIAGDYRLEIDDIYAGRRFEDGIASCAWPVEVHEGGTATRWDWLAPGLYYQLPWRCLLPRGLANVIAAGRCLSASHDAHASVRVTATCMAMGQAAGTAAALAADAGLADVRALPFADLRRALLAQGALLDADPAAAPAH